MTRAPSTNQISTGSRLTELFCMLAAIPSPTGFEAACGAAVTAELELLGLTIERDGASARIGGDCDNLYCRITGTAPGQPVFLCAHLDTVPPAGVLRPIVEDGVIRNATPSIVGADNKAAVAVLLHIARSICTDGIPHAGVELVFTVGEEQGLRGSSAFDMGVLRAGTGFVLDHPGAIGSYVAAAPSRFIVTAVMKGRAAHTGISPEDGINAIAAVARAVAVFPPTTTAVSVNVAQIEGGNALNVVPDRARVAVDIRSLDHEEGLAAVEEIKRTLRLAGDTVGATVEVDVRNPYVAYRLHEDSSALRLAESACNSLGLPLEPIETRGGSDANAFHAAGLDCVNLAHGVVDFHGPEERIAVADLVLMERVVRRILAAACDEQF